jgi:hypothetical protein
MMRGIFSLLVLLLLGASVYAASGYATKDNYCGDGFCNQTAGENCKNCPMDCGPCPTCTPKYYCKDSTSQSYLNAQCDVTSFKCEAGSLCKDGTCVEPAISAYMVAQTPELSLPVGASFVLAGILTALIAISVYAFIRVETDL